MYQYYRLRVNATRSDRRVTELQAILNLRQMT